MEELLKFQTKYANIVLLLLKVLETQFSKNYLLKFHEIYKTSLIYNGNFTI